MKTLRPKDWIGVALGVWLLASPWVLAYSGFNVATLNALVVGYLLVLVELFEVGAHEPGDEWIYLVAGAWMMSAPEVLRFGDATAAALNAVVVGGLMVLVAIASLSLLGSGSRAPSRT